MPSASQWYMIFAGMGRKDAAESFHDVFDDAFDMDDLARRYEASQSYGELTAMAAEAYKAEFSVMEREGLKDEWMEQQEDSLDEAEEDGAERIRCYESYQSGYRDVSVGLLADDIVEHHAEMLDDGEFEDEDDDADEDEDDAEGEEAEDE